MRPDIRKSLRLTIAAAIVSACSLTSSATSPLGFASASRLGEGKWVKIGVGQTGVCRLTYAQLEEMGFTEPSAVAVYGRGGAIMPENFTDKDGNLLYTDDLPPVATMHRGDAIYFYAQGPAQVEYTPEGADRTSINVYTDKAYYFLSQGRADALMMAKAHSTESNGRIIDKGIAWQLIEEENIFPRESGEEYFGWDITKYPGRKISFDYSIPGSTEGSACTVALRGAAKISGPETMTISLVSDNGTTVPGSVNFRNLSVNSDYSYPTDDGSAVIVKGTVPAAAGKIEVAIEPSPRSSAAYIDYIVLAAERQLTFQDGEKVIEAFLPSLDSPGTGISLGNVPSDLVTWDVASSADVTELSTEIQVADGSALVSGARTSEGHNRLVAFSLSAPLQTITGFSDVKNQNLHALADGETPAMLVITIPELRSAAEKLAGLHRTYQNERVVVATSEEIVNEFSQGTPDPMAYRGIARMFYDADKGSGRTFNSVLLLGPMRVDHRGLFTPLPDTPTLLCKQTFSGNSVTTTFTIPDFYGMMADHYGDEVSGDMYYLRNQDLAVGVIPADYEAMANLYVEKTGAWLADTSAPYWLSDVAYTADGSNENEHILECDILAKSWNETDNAFTPHKLYNNCFPAGQVHANFVKTINSGVHWINYLGHASNAGLNTLLWNKGDHADLTNDRLGFMMFGGCTISSFDKGRHGSGEGMILSTPHGLIGGIISTRTTLSTSNFMYILDVVNASLKQQPFGEGKSDALLRSPRTFGEIDRMARSANSRGNSNKLAYVLMCDPALKSLMPSAGIKITGKEGSALTELLPGADMEFEGTVSDRDGKLLSGFDGTAVLKLFSPAMTAATRQYGNSGPIDITHDDFLVLTLETKVTGGCFSGRLTVPQTLAGYDNVTLRAAAFNPSTRQTATGSLTARALPFSETESQADGELPVIESFYADRSSFQSGDAVPDPAVLYAIVTDNAGLKTGFGNSPDAGLTLAVDGKLLSKPVSQFVTVTDDGRTLKLRLQLDGMTPGMHTASLKVSDLSGNIATAAIRFNIQDMLPSATEVKIASSLVRDKAEFTLTTTPESGYAPAKAVIVITDELGKEVKRLQADGGTADWDATDTEGTRVHPGTYYVRCSYVTESGSAGITAPERMVVLRPKE